MKKILSIFFFFVALACGCSEEDLFINQAEISESVRFTAMFEQNESRTYVEEGHLLCWTKGDQISLFQGNTLNCTYKFDGETGDNDGTFSFQSKPFGSSTGLDRNYAVYPYNSDIKISANGEITAILPAVQNYAENSFGLGANAMVAATMDTDDTILKFKNVGGCLKLRLYGDDVTVKSITLKGNNNEKLAGKATITSVYGQVPIVEMTNDATNSITLDCGNGVKIGSTEKTATAFWLVVPPTTLESGFEITITDVNGSAFTKSTTKNIAIERNVIKPMAAFKVETKITIPNNQIWYTSRDGKVLTPFHATGFGANIVSNVYKNGKGIMTFDNYVTTIGKEEFQHSTSLTEITIPNSVTTIGEYAFYNCYSLTEITIPNSVKTIGDWAFAACNSLTEITIPNSVTTIGDSAFGGCNMAEITIPNSVTTIGEYAFSDCHSLTEITIPNSVTTIGDWSFFWCTSLTKITIPNSVKTIGKGTFCKCTSLTEITIPNSVTTIGDSAFRGCDSLTKVTIPNSVTIIGEETFSDCHSLTEITIPNSVKTIGDWAFAGCSSLAKVNVEATTPPLCDIPFTNYNLNLKIYVPAESLEDYKKAKCWKELNLLPNNQ